MLGSRKQGGREGDWSARTRLVRRARGTAEAVHGRDQGCQGTEGGKELNRGLGATSEEMVGGRRIGEDQALGTGKRGKEDEVRTRMRTRIRRTRRRK